MARLLAVTSRLPYPPQEGHQHRSWHLLRAMARHHEVTLLSLLRPGEDTAGLAHMREVLAAVEVFPLPRARDPRALLRAGWIAAARGEPLLTARYALPALRRRIACLARAADLVHFDILPLMHDADLVPRGTPVVYNAHNVEHALLAGRAGLHSGGSARAWALRAALRQQAARLCGFERDACARADLVLACSEVDAAALRTLAGARVEVVPNGVDLEACHPAATASASEDLVFVGQMGWFPNHDGIAWFLRDVLPAIVARRPRARLVLVGRDEGLQVPEAMAAHVVRTGFVDDLRPHVQAAAAYVVPLRAGSGTRLKVLEAMAMGKAIVSTRVGSEGIDLVHGRDALFADDAADFAAAVVRVLEDGALRHSLGAAARASAERGYGWDAIGDVLLGHYARLLPRAAVPAPPLQREPAAAG